MPQRPRQHVLETESRHALRAALPLDWPFRDENPDYGADLSVEIVKQGVVTGQRFFVQLKATDEPRLGKALQVKLKQKAFRYLQNLNTPALLVVYHAPTRQLYARWVHDLDVFYAGNSASYFTFRFEPYDSLDRPDLPDHLLHTLGDWDWIHASTLAGPLLLQLNFHTDAVRGVPVSQIAEALERLAAPLVGKVAIREVPAGKVRGNIDVTANDLHIRFLGGSGAGIHRSLAAARRNRGKRTKTKPRKESQPSTGEAVAADILAGVAFAVHHANHRALAADMAELAFASASVSLNIFGAGMIAGMLLDQGRHVPIVRALVGFERDGHVELAQLALAAMFVTTPPPEVMDDLVEALDAWLDEASRTHPQDAFGTAHYNVAHYVSRVGYARRGVIGFAKAARLHPDYRRRGYFWEEFGGMLFHLGRFLWSARAYDRAAGMGRATRAKQADALWRAGRYADAQAAIQQYNGRDAHWLALRSVLPIVIEVMGADSQQRDPGAAAIHVEAGLAATDPDARAAACLAAIRADAMSGLAWFNLGATFGEKNQLLDASLAFLTAALIQTWDVQAWANAISGAAASLRDAQSDKDRDTATVLFSLALQAGVPLHREALFRELVRLLGLDTTEGRYYLRNLFAQVPEPVDTPPVLRLSFEDGTVELPMNNPERAFEMLSAKVSASS